MESSAEDLVMDVEYLNCRLSDMQLEGSCAAHMISSGPWCHGQALCSGVHQEYWLAACLSACLGAKEAPCATLLCRYCRESGMAERLALMDKPPPPLPPTGSLSFQGQELK